MTCQTLFYFFLWITCHKLLLACGLWAHPPKKKKKQGQEGTTKKKPPVPDGELRNCQTQFITPIGGYELGLIFFLSPSFLCCSFYFSCTRFTLSFKLCGFFIVIRTIFHFLFLSICCHTKKYEQKNF